MFYGNSIGLILPHLEEQTHMFWQMACQAGQNFISPIGGIVSRFSKGQLPADCDNPLPVRMTHTIR
jgi:hypothetical protein